MALIVTEAVNNAIEHGLPHRGGSIHVGLDISDGTITLDITDDGKGLPANFDPGFGQSLGLRISNALAGQLNGRFSLMHAAKCGATARLDLPARASRQTGTFCRLSRPIPSAMTRPSCPNPRHANARPHP